MKKLFVFFTTVVVLIFSSWGFSAEKSDQPPAEILIKSVVTKVISDIKAEKIAQSKDKKRAYDLIEKEIVPHFDMERISQLVLGKSYLVASNEEKESFKKEFSSLLTYVYSKALIGYKNQVVEYSRAQIIDNVNVVVKTAIMDKTSSSDSPSIDVNYVMGYDGNAWKVYDVEIEGISWVNNYRNQFSPEIRQNGFKSMLSKLRHKNETNLSSL